MDLTTYEDPADPVAAVALERRAAAAAKYWSEKMITKPAPFRKQSDAIREICGVLAKHPTGIESNGIAKALNRGDESIVKWMRKLKTAGAAAKWPDTLGPCKWCLPEHLEQTKAAHRAFLVEAKKAEAVRKNAAARAKAAEKRKERIARVELPDDDAFYMAPTMRIVPAHCVPPLRPRGPASVWELAA